MYQEFTDAIRLHIKQKLQKGPVRKPHIHYKQCKKDEHGDFCMVI